MLKLTLLSSRLTALVRYSGENPSTCLEKSRCLSGIASGRKYNLLSVATESSNHRQKHWIPEIHSLISPERKTHHGFAAIEMDVQPRVGLVNTSSSQS